MLTATDSFIEYLASNLNDDPTVYWWRQSAGDEHAGLLKQNSLNVTFLGFFQDGSAEYILTSLDLLAADERQAMRWLELVRDLLIAEQVIPELDYAASALPVVPQRAVSWDGDEIQFLSIRTPRGTRYVHYNATFPLLHTRM